jgi:hypothetical protein
VAPPKSTGGAARSTGCNLLAGHLASGIWHLACGHCRSDGDVARDVADHVAASATSLAALLLLLLLLLPMAGFGDAEDVVLLVRELRDACNERAFMSAFTAADVLVRRLVTGAGLVHSDDRPAASDWQTRYVRAHMNGDP